MTGVIFENHIISVKPNTPDFEREHNTLRNTQQGGTLGLTITKKPISQINTIKGIRLDWRQKGVPKQARYWAISQYMKNGFNGFIVQGARGR